MNADVCVFVLVKAGAHMCLSIHVVAVEVKLGPKVVMLNLLACTVVWLLQAQQDVSSFLSSLEVVVLL